MGHPQSHVSQGIIHEGGREGDKRTGDTGDEKEETTGYMRNFKVVPSWWHNAREYTVLAACQPQQKAYEKVLDGKIMGGLTYHVIKSLRYLGPSYSTISYSELHRSVSLDMVDWHQTPVLLGRYKHAIFGEDEMTSFRHGTVAAVNDGNTITLDIGDVNGVCVQDIYTIYPDKFTLDFKPVNCTVHEVYQLSSLATIPTREQDVQNLKGQKVKLVRASLLNTVGIRILHSIENSQKMAVSHAGQNREIFEISGEGPPLLHLPKLPATAENTRTLVKILQHVARYKLVANLHNKTSNLHHNFVFNIQDNAGNNANPKTTKVGEILKIEFENKLQPEKDDSKNLLYLTIFNLNPLWGIRQISPEPKDQHQHIIEPGRSLEPLDIKGCTPPELRGKGLSEYTDVILAIITTRPTSFEAFTLPDLIEVWRSSEDTGQEAISNNESDLAGLLEALSTPKRHYDRVEKNTKETNGDWQTIKVLIRTEIVR
ncbi:hypothetical protein BP5796_12586 [Coleophoma crateriformis]|uniref:Uncharacterized protein n=1 Tax=Coleophoma crateriformis TaxID=565419 RepID=A0A3D8Q7G8_9HELO|nr:hypothetical protein BP5796_12586 [Coleophoma crateriformis]